MSKLTKTDLPTLTLIDKKSPSLAQREDEDPQRHWYAIWTRSRQEKSSAAMLESIGVEYFLPLKVEKRQWSDRKQKVSLPLFSSYLFVKTNTAHFQKQQILRAPGVVGFVGNSQGPLAIPEEQIENVRSALDTGLDFSKCPYPEEGDRVRVTRGALSGTEGILLRVDSQFKLIISVELIQQAVTVSVSADDVELIGPMVSPLKAYPD